MQKRSSATLKRSEIRSSRKPDTDLPIDAALQTRLIEAIRQAPSATNARQRLVSLIQESCEDTHVVLAVRQENGDLAIDTTVEAFSYLPPESIKQITEHCGTVCDNGEILSETISGAKQWRCVFAPVIRRTCQPDVIALITAANNHPVSSARLAAVAQMAASHFTMWELLSASRQSESTTQCVSAMTDLVSKINQTDSRELACQTIASEMKSFLGSSRVDLGLCDRSGRRVRWMVSSNVSQVDRHSAEAKLLDSAMSEVAVRKQVTAIDREGILDRRLQDDSSSHDSLIAHRGLASHFDASHLWTVPLVDAKNKCIGVVSITRNEPATKLEPSSQASGNREAGSPTSADLAFLELAKQHLGIALVAVAGRRKSFAGRCLAAVVKGLTSIRGWLGMLGLMGIIAAGMIPMPYQVSCECVLEPTVRRYIAAPYEGRLEESTVRPGDVVSEGEVIARMDRRELKWELSGLQADYRSAKKERDAASARDEVSEAQHADLEMQRLDVKMQLIAYRLDHLEIKTPIDGVVLSGDLSRSEGIPLSTGQTLYEIAPLENMIVEVAIPESDIQFVTSDMEVAFRLEGDPTRKRTGSLLRIHPRSEIRDHQSVFIAEVKIDNDERYLRPGMKGVARIETAEHPLVWNWTHKAWESIAMKLGI